MGYFVYGSPTGCCTAGSGAILAGIDLNGGSPTWQFIGDGNIAMAPLLIDDHVFAASQSGKVYALGAQSGTLDWTGDAGSTLFGTDEHDVAMLTGMAVGSGHLVVPAGSRITAWRMVP
jgi:outer membrane protein assembly factor BamB